MRKYLIFLSLISLLVGCKKNELSLTDIKNRVEIDYTYKINSLKGLAKPSSEINQIVSYKNNLILFDYRYKTAYISDLKFNIINKYDLTKDYEKLFNGKISDLFLLEDTLFIGDDTYIIKKLDMTNGKVKSLPLKINLFQNFPFSLFVNSSGEIITSFRCMFNNSKDRAKWDYVWGSVFDRSGKQIDALGSNKEMFDYDLIGFDHAYYNEYGNYKFVCFAYSKNVIQLNSENTKFTLYGNKGWTKPHYGPNKTFSAHTMNYQKLVKYKNYFLIPALPEKAGLPTCIVVYDLLFKPVKIIELKKMPESYWYDITLSGDNMILYTKSGAADPAFYVFDLTNAEL